MPAAGMMAFLSCFIVFKVKDYVLAGLARIF